MYENVKYEVTESGVALITLNRPEAMNAFNLGLVQDMVAVANQANQDENVKVVVVTGAGKGFSSGGDIALLFGMDSPAKAKLTYDASTSAVQAFYEIEKPVIAALNGPVAGASTSLMMGCDLVIASEKAKLGFTFAQIAFCPDSGCSHFLVKKVGYQKAAEILYFGKLLTAQEGFDLGLINKIVPPEQLLDEAMKWAEQLAAGPLLAIKLDKKLLREAYHNDFYKQAELEAMYQVLTWSSDDFKEGCQAFIQKRKPNFTGK
ncbi:MAG: enoyl-CoA hydratase/isomerase family protein [Solirubrobacterales bacterium]